MKLLGLAFLIIVLLSSSAFSQSPTSTQRDQSSRILTGVVYDVKGAVIVNLTRVIAYSRDGKQYESATNAEGVYKLEVPLAIYRIEVSAPGFCLERVGRFRVVNSTHGKMSLDFVLEVAASTGRNCKHEVIEEKTPKRRTKKKLEIMME